METQQFRLEFAGRAPRVGLYPTGGRGDPCVVKCVICTYTDTAPTWAEASRLAREHDWQHAKEETP